MNDFSTYLAAQHLTREAVNNARPDAPLRSDGEPAALRAGIVAARQGISLTLRRLADILQPAPERSGPVLPAVH